MYTIQTSPERKLKLCAIPTCQGKRYDLVHKFPMNNERAQCWIDAIDLAELREMPIDIVRKRYFICSKHFRPQDYKNCESRSLNTTAYPRLHLKIGVDDESTEPNSSNIEISADELQELEFIMPEGAGDTVAKEIDIDTVYPVNIDTPSSVKYFVCSDTDNVPILLHRNQKKQQPNCIFGKSSRTQTIPQKPLVQKSMVNNSVRDTEISSRAINVIDDKRIPHKYTAKRFSTSASEIPNKKTCSQPIEHIQIKEDNGNDMSVVEPAMITLHFKPLNLSFEVCSFWLRDHCRCSLCYSDMAQRKTNLLDIPLDIEPTELKTENDTVSITWSDGHESNYNICNLYNQLHPSSDMSLIKPVLWSASDIVCSDYANVTQNDYFCNDEVAKAVVVSLIKFGFALIKNVPASEQSTEIAVRRLFPTQKTHFGDSMWSFTSNRSRNDSAYTNEALLPHNDNTYFNDAAGLQVLHCINRTNVDGGDTILVDGFHVLKKLREQNAEAYEYLSQTSIPSEYIEDKYHFKHCAPIIVLDPVTNEPLQMRFNMSDRAFFNTLPQKQVMQFYKHYTALAKEVLSSENEWRFQLEPGTVCIFDNWRLLHGRTAFNGRRQMVGCYVSRREFLSVARRHGIIS